MARLEMPTSPGNPFYEKLNALLQKAGFDAFVEELCTPFYAKKVGRPSIPPGRYFRMLLLGYFEGTDSECGICWRCEDSLPVREFGGQEPTESAPDQSSMTRICQRLPLETHHAVFEHLHKLLAKRKLFSGKFLGVDSSTMEAKTSLKAIVRRDTGENSQEMLKRLAKESGIETPTAEHPVQTIADKGYHSRTVLKALPAHFRSRSSEPARPGILRWHGDSEARDAVYRNRACLVSRKGQALMRARAERVERSFAHCLDRGGMRLVWLRGVENIEKRYIIHVAGFNPCLLMRTLFGGGTPQGWKESPCGLFLWLFAGMRGVFQVIGVTLGDTRRPCPLTVLITLPL